VYFARGGGTTGETGDPLQGVKLRRKTHKYELLRTGPARPLQRAGWRVDSSRFPISKTITGVVLDLEPGALRELHWHPTADEWQYLIEGRSVLRCSGSAVAIDRNAGEGRRRLHPAGVWASIETSATPRAGSHRAQYRRLRGVDFTVDRGQPDRVRHNFGKPGPCSREVPAQNVLLPTRTEIGPRGQWTFTISAIHEA